MSKPQKPIDCARLSLQEKHDLAVAKVERFSRLLPAPHRVPTWTFLPMTAPPERRAFLFAAHNPSAG